MSHTPLGTSQNPGNGTESNPTPSTVLVVVEIESQVKPASDLKGHPIASTKPMSTFFVTVGILCLLNLIFGLGLVAIAELERNGIATNLSNFSLTLVLLPYCMWIMTSVTLHFVLLRCFADIAPHCRGEEFRSLRRMLLRCVDGFMLVPTLVYFVVRVFLSKDSTEFFASSGAVARTAMMTGIIIEFSELTTYSTSDWTLAAHHVGELIVTLLCIEWVPGADRRESALFILTLLTAFDRCAYPYFFLSKLRFLREKYCPSANAPSLIKSVAEKPNEPTTVPTIESPATPESTACDERREKEDVLFDLTEQTLRLLARATFAYYAIFVRLLVLALLIAHLIVKKDTMLLGWQIALIPAFLAFAAVDIPVYIILWKRSQWRLTFPW